MTGAEHYAEAEQLLGQAADPDTSIAMAGYLVAAAQVHATLALVAAHEPPLLIPGMPG